MDRPAEIVPLVIATAGFMEVEMEKLPEPDAIVFEGYLGGLREAGWRGARRMARLGYAAVSTLHSWFGLRFGVMVFLDERLHTRTEELTQRPIEEHMDRGAAYYRFHLDLDHEAHERTRKTRNSFTKFVTSPEVLSPNRFLERRPCKWLNMRSNP